MSAVLVTLTRFPDIFARFRASADTWEPEVEKVVVTSGGATVDAPGWRHVIGEEPFVFARNANRGIRAARDVRGASGVLLINDDCELTEPIITRCEALTAAHPSVGVLAPQINGGAGSALQRVGAARGLVGRAREYYAVLDLSFICVYIPFSTFLRVGDLDEGYTGYGYEDRDFGHRVRVSGLELGVTPLCSVRHGFGGRSQSSSFLRVSTPAEHGAAFRAARKQFREKFRAR